MGFDAMCWENFYSAEMRTSWLKTYLFTKIHRLCDTRLMLKKYHYRDIIAHYFSYIDSLENVYPTIVANFDRSPRGANKAVIYYGSTPELFKKHVNQAIGCIKDKQEEHRILFLRSWNEWGEGNYIEPDAQYGTQYLDVLRDCLTK